MKQRFRFRHNRLATRLIACGFLVFGLFQAMSHQQTIAEWVSARVRGGVQAALTGVTLNNGNGNVFIGNDVTSQTTALSPDTGAYTWSINGSPYAALITPFGSAGLQNDFSGNGNNGVRFATAFASSGCVVGGCLTFDAGDYVVVGNSASLNPTSKISFGGWIKPTANGSAFYVILAKPFVGDIGGNEQYMLFKNDGTGMLSSAIKAGGSIVYLDSNVTWASIQNIWTHVMATYDGATFRLYVNGSANTSTPKTGALNTDTNSFYIGGIELGGFASFVGSIDEVQIYPHALDAAQIYQIYSDGNAGLGGPTTIQAEETVAGQVWDLSITPITTDGSSGSVIESSNPVIILSGAPTITGTLDNPDEGSPIISALTIPGGSTAGYRWMVNGANYATLNMPFNTGGTQSDISGNASHGTVFGATFTTSGCRVGGCLSFDGNDYVTQTLPSTVKTANITMSSWVKQTTTTGGQILVAAEPGGANAFAKGFHTFLSGGVAVVSKGSGTGVWIQEAGTTVLPAGTWHHIVGTFDGSALRIYVNGVLEGTTLNGLAIDWSDAGGGNYPDPAQLYLGAFKDNALNAGATVPNLTFLNGVLDEVAIYGRALSHAEILQLYQDGLASVGGPTRVSAQDHAVGETWDLFATEFLSGGTVGVANYIDNATIVTAATTTPGITTPVGTQLTNVTINYSCADTSSLLRDFLVEYSTNGGSSYANATLVSTSSGTVAGSMLSMVACNSGTSNNSFVWNSLADSVAIGVLDADVRIRVTAQYPSGPSAETGNFSVQNATINTFTTPTTISSVNTTYDNTHIICSGTTLTVDGTHPFASLTLQNSCTLTQTATTSGTVNRTILTVAGAVSVDATSSINMDGRGFPIGYTSNGVGGATTTGASTSNKGGAHGGFGGLGASGNNGVTYDSIQEPVDPGGGSGANAGGGYVKIITNSLALNGTVRANGASAGCCSGGAGGGIWIAVSGSVTGSGSILANGGNGTDINNGAGGGGRVAFYYDTSVSGNGSLDLTFQVYGGTNAGAVANNLGGAGTLYTERTNIDVATQGTVTVNNNNVITGRTSTVTNSTFGAIAVSNRALAENASGTVIVTNTVTIDNNATFSASTLTVTNAVTLTNTATLNHATTTSSTVYRLNLTAGSLSVDATSSVNLDGLGFPAGYTSNGAGGATTTNASTSNAGGSHGGLGGLGMAGVAALVYDSIKEPADPGSGSGVEAGSVGLGGGYAKLTLGALTINGTISADGIRVTNTGGAGGGLWIVVTGSVSGTGTIRANGGNSNEINNGAGGGGRVAFYYNTSQPGNGSLSPTFQLFGGTSTGATSRYGGAGTLYIERTNIDTPGQGTVTVSNNNVVTDKNTNIPTGTYGSIVATNRGLAENAGGTLTVTDSVAVSNTGTLAASTLTVTNAVTLTNSGVLTHRATNASTVYRLILTAGSISIDATSSINLDGRGFPAGYTTNGLGGVTTLGASTSNAGGSHAGRGGLGAAGTAAAAYNSVLEPLEPGSGSGVEAGAVGLGGGYAKITVGTLTVNGTISANGTRVAFTGGGGGGLWIIVSGSVSGTGTIRANGGDSNEVNNGAGGGGRVAFYYDSTQSGNGTLTPSFQAFGGANPGAAATNVGGAGTVFIKDASLANGDLIVNNNNVVSSSTRATPLFVSVPAGLPTTYTVRNLSVINQARLLIDTPCAGTPALTVTGIVDLSGSGTISNNQPGTCTVSQPVINITTTTLPTAEVNVAYSQSIASTGGYGPHTFVCRNGGVTVACTTVLPAGLDMSSAGVVSGTPTVTGTTLFTVRATEASPGIGTDDQTISITVGNAPSAPTNLFANSTDAQSCCSTPTTDTTPVFSAVFNDSDAGNTASKYRIQLASDAGFTTLLWNSDASGIALGGSCAVSARCANITYAGSALSAGGVTYYWRIKYWDNSNLEGPFSATSSFTTSTAPTAPTTLFTNDANAQSGLTNPVGILAEFPVFSAVFNDPDIGDTATKYRIQVSTTNNFSALVWNSNASGTNMPTCTAGTRCDDIVFGGTALERDETIYYWRIKFWDAAGVEGAWSQDPTSTNTFKMGTGGGSNQVIQQQQQAPQPTVPDAPIAGAVEVLGPNSVRYNWIDVSTNEMGFRVLNAENQVIADVAAGQTSVVESSLVANTLVEGRKVLAYNSLGQSAAVPFATVRTAAPVVQPFVQQRGGDSVTFIIEPAFTVQSGQTSAFPGQTAVRFDVIVTDVQGVTRTMSSDWIQSNEYTFSGIAPADEVQIRVVTRNEAGLENEPSLYQDVGSLSRRFVVNMGVFKKGTETLPRPMVATDVIAVRMQMTSVGTDAAHSVILNLPLPRYINYVPGTLIVDGRNSTDLADQQGSVANQNGVSASWATVSPGDSHTITFELAFDIEDLRSLRDTALIIDGSELATEEASLEDVVASIVSAAANPLIHLQASVSFADSDVVYMSPVITLEPDVETAVEPVIEDVPVDETPIEEQPVQIPTPEETQIIEQILQQEFPQPTPAPQPGQPAPEPAPAPTLQTGETTTDSDAGSFNLIVTGEGAKLGLTGNASVQADQIQFTGTTTEPFTVITLIFNNSVTAIAVSDANGFWQTFVDADRLGILPGQEASVTIEAIAAKGDLRSERVSVGDVVISRGRSGDIAAEFDTTVSDSPIVSVLEEIEHQVVKVVEEQEPVIKATLTVSAPIVIVSSAPLWGYLPYAPTLIYHFISWMLGLVGRKRKDSGVSTYGVVYDAITKLPLALAIVRVYNQADNKLASTIVTDKLGRYDVLLSPGQYRLEVSKPQYQYPSGIVTSAVDGTFDRIYNKQTGFNVTEQGTILPHVPVDPVNAQRQWQLSFGFKKLWLAFQRAGNLLATPIILVGLFMSLALLYAVPDKPSNWIIAGLYALTLAIQFKLKPKLIKAWGVVYDVASNAILPLVTIQLIEPATSKVVTSRLSDYEGRFTFLPEPGTYVLKASKPGFTQVTEVVQSPFADRQPLPQTIDIKKPSERVNGDVPMKQGG